MSPKPARTRKEQKAATRQDLLDAARRCFRDRGYAHTRAGDISRAAGVAHGTFYVHFANKQAVLDELLVEFNERLAERLGDAVTGAVSKGLEAAIRACAEVFLDYWDEHRDFVAAYVQRTSTGLSPAELTDGINPPVASLLRHTLTAEAVRRGHQLTDPDLVAHGLLAMWLRIGLRYLFSPGVTPRAALDALVHLTLGAIAGAFALEAHHDD